MRRTELIEPGIETLSLINRTRSRRKKKIPETIISSTTKSAMTCIDRRGSDERNSASTIGQRISQIIQTRKA